MSLNNHSYIQVSKFSNLKTILKTFNLHNFQIIKTLAFIDFVDLSIYSAPKRNQIFSLSLTSKKLLIFNNINL